MVVVVQAKGERLSKVSVPKATLQDLEVEIILLGATLPPHTPTLITH